MLKVWTNGTDTVVAENLDEVQAIVEKQHGTTFAAECWSQDDWWQEDDDKVLRIVDNESEFSRRGFKTETNPRTGHEVVARTCAEWIASEGRGFLCSTEY